MISIDTTYAGVSTVTPPAVGLRCPASVEPDVRLDVRMAAPAAPWNGTGLPIAGVVPAVRLRGLLAAAGTTGSTTTGAPFGTDALPSAQSSTVQRTTPKGFAIAGVVLEHDSSTPGDLPPEDPLS